MDMSTDTLSFRTPLPAGSGVRKLRVSVDMSINCSSYS